MKRLTIFFGVLLSCLGTAQLSGFAVQSCERSVECRTFLRIPIDYDGKTTREIGPWSDTAFGELQSTGYSAITRARQGSSILIRRGGQELRIEGESSTQAAADSVIQRPGGVNGFSKLEVTFNAPREFALSVRYNLSCVSVFESLGESTARIRLSRWDGMERFDIVDKLVDWRTPSASDQLTRLPSFEAGTYTLSVDGFSSQRLSQGLERTRSDWYVNLRAKLLRPSLIGPE